jgi:16S rRNA (cytidine1402-2'-O)-methyltransferase
MFRIDGREFTAGPLSPGLYLVPTPIGNLGDITLRALDVLAACDRIYCEDTRVTRKLARHFAITTPLTSYNDHNGAKVRPVLLAAIEAGQACALVSDAGMPLISDPGFKLVTAARARGLNVWALPGANAPITALAASGLPSDRFLFAGFVPPKPGARDRFLAQLAGAGETVILFETARRLGATLRAMAPHFADREIAIARELSKRHEEVLRGPLPDLMAQLETRDALKGELVLLIAPDKAASGNKEAVDRANALLVRLAPHFSTRDAADIAARAFDLSKSDAYALALASRKTS